MKVSISNIAKFLRNSYWRIVEKVDPIVYWRHQLFLADDISDYIFRDECMERLSRLEWPALRSKMDQYHLSVQDIPVPAGAESHWIRGQYDERDYLSLQTIKAIKKVIEEREYERSKHRREVWEGWIKWITAIASIVAAGASIYTAFRDKLN